MNLVGIYILGDASLFGRPESNPSGLGTQPQVQVSPQSTAVHEGETLRLYCRASGSPTPKLTWLKNGGQIPPQVRHAFLRKGLYLHSAELKPCPALRGVSGVELCHFTWLFHIFWQLFDNLPLFSLPSVCLLHPFFCFVLLFFSFAPTLFWRFAQAIPSHGFHQFKSNSLDVLHRRIEELQVCPSVRCLSVPSRGSHHSSSTHHVSPHCPLSAWLDVSLIHAL